MQKIQLRKGLAVLAVPLSFLVVVMVWAPSQVRADEPILKMDVPKIDASVPKPPADSAKDSAQLRKQILHGKVEHAEELSKKKLFTSIGKGQLENNLQSGRSRADKSMLKAKSNQDMLDAEAQLGIGIIGVRFVMGFGSPPVINKVFPGTPAFRVGLKPNDVILAVDGIPTLGLTKQEVYEMIVGTPNTPVTLSLRRNGDFQAQTLNRMDFNDITDPAVRRDYLMSM